MKAANELDQIFNPLLDAIVKLIVSCNFPSMLQCAAFETVEKRCLVGLRH